MIRSSGLRYVVRTKGLWRKEFAMGALSSLALRLSLPAFLLVILHYDITVTLSGFQMRRMELGGKILF